MVQDNQSELPPIQIQTQLAQDVESALGQNVYLCYQCIKCTSGCPLASYFDWQPNQIMRLVQLGQEETVFSAQAPWICASCQTCTTRCPQDLDVAGIMDFLVRESVARGYPPQIPAGEVFAEAFMREVRLWGRAYELGMMAELKLRTRNLYEDLDLGVRMIRKGKLGVFPAPAFSPNPKSVKPIPGAASAVAYYPGCSLHSTAPEFDISARAVCRSLGIELIEPPGWVCCGGSAAHRVSAEEAYQLPLRNLSLIEQYGFEEAVMPCAACFNRHKFAQHDFQNARQKAVPEEAPEHNEGQSQVRINPLHATLLRRAGIAKIKENTRKDLSQLKVVCYYGCLLTRPPDVTEAPHPENPMEIDTILEAMGVEVLDWSYKTTCCGAAHALVRPDIVRDLARELIHHAREAGADLMVVACPLCHMNLDARQFQLKLDDPLPILYFTQLLAVGFDLPLNHARLDKNLVDPLPVLQSVGVV